jgi:DNA primase
MIDYNITLLISYIPLSQLNDKGEYFSCICPYHPDKNPSLHIMKGVSRPEIKGLVKCMSCGKITHIYKLCEDLTGQNMYKLLGIEGELEDYQFKHILKEQNKSHNPFINKLEKVEKKELIIDGELEEPYNNIKLMKYLYNNRKIKNKFIDAFGIKYARKVNINKPYDKLKNKGTWFIDRFVIPIYENNKLISMEGRIYYESEYTKVLYPKLSSSNVLFNYENINKNELVYIVEGIMGLSSIWQYLSTNVIATMGKVLTSYQKKLIAKLPYICIIPDNDFPDNDNVKDMLEIYDEFYPHEYELHIIEKEKTDPNDLSIEEIKKIPENKVSSIEYLMNKYELFPDYKVNW